MIIYVDVLIITNFIINYFLFRITQVFSSSLYDKRRLILSSFIGSLFSLIVILDIESFIVLLLIKIIAVSLSVFIAFGFQNYYYYFKNLLSLLLANFILHGFLGMLQDNNTIILENTVIYLNINPVLLVLCVFFIWVIVNVFNLFLNERLSDEDIKIKIYFNEKEIELNAFYDTGFKIKDIINNKSVILVNFNQIKRVLNLDEINCLEDFYKGIEKEKSLMITPIFYSTINGNGIIPAIKPNKITLSSKSNTKDVKNCLVALSKEDISNEKEIIIGKEVFKLLSK